MNSELKTINYRGGVVKFQIPSHWREEYDPKGGGVFYADTSDSSTFRLNVVTAKAPFHLTHDSAPDVLSQFAEASSDCIESLPNGCAFARYARIVPEGDQQLLITYWVVAQIISESHARIASFSHTILESQQNDIQFQSELALLDREIRACIFSPVLG